MTFYFNIGDWVIPFSTRYDYNEEAEKKIKEYLSQWRPPNEIFKQEIIEYLGLLPSDQVRVVGFNQGEGTLEIMGDRELPIASKLKEEKIIEFTVKEAEL